MLGNFLNGNTYRGGAFGIKIASINRLIDTKGTSKSTTLLHFLVDAVEKNFPTALGFLEELDECELASKGTQICTFTYMNEKINFDKASRAEMSIEYQSIETDLKKLEIELEQHYPMTGEVELDKFSTTMHQFYKEAATEFKRIVMLSKKMDETYDHCVRFYGEDPKKTQPDEFFGIFREFTKSWEKCSADAKEFKLKQDRIQKQKKREQERRKRLNSGAGSIKSKENEEDKAILHSLLDKLKKDTLDVKARRRGQRNRQRSTSSNIHSVQHSFSTQHTHPDSTYAQANRMLFNIQNENTLLEGQGFFDYGQIQGRRKSTPSIPTRSLLFDAAATASSALLDDSSIIPEESNIRSSSDIIIPTFSTSTQSRSSVHLTPSITTTTRPVRVRKTSKRPIFDYTLRVRSKRTTTR